MYGHRNIVELPRRRNILTFSDLQFSSHTTSERLQLILQEIQLAVLKYHIDYLFFLGDLINSLEEVAAPERRTRLLKWLREITQIAPLIMIIGNHDYSYNDHYVRNSVIFQQWCDDLRQIPQLYLLGTSESQQIFDDGSIRVMGVMLPDECYPADTFSGNNATAAYRTYLSNLLPQLKAVPDREYYLLMHSPRHLNKVPLEPDIFTIAGHSHNGLIPPILDELLRFTTRGLIAPGYRITQQHYIRYELFAPNSRIRPRADRHVMTIHPSTYFSISSHLEIFNRFYPRINYSIIHDCDSNSKFDFRSQYFRVSPL